MVKNILDLSTYLISLQAFKEQNKTKQTNKKKNKKNPSILYFKVLQLQLTVIFCNFYGM